ncbi:hypothetical protein RIF29_33993 [Crotalaria pallida]|uniref:DUF4283 domain-containing protein n=1 Tax=Crotalaria pallida TaxID=3830 RepID=A0AAN9HT48_CROPI
MSSARVSKKSTEEEDLLDRSTKKPKGDSLDSFTSSFISNSHENVVEESLKNHATVMGKSFVHALEGRSDSPFVSNGVHVCLEGGPSPNHETEAFDSGDLTGITVVENMHGKYECPEFILDRKEKESIIRPWKQGLIVKMLGRKIGYKALENRLKQLWVRRGVIDIIDLDYDYYLVKFSNE